MLIKTTLISILILISFNAEADEAYGIFEVDSLSLEFKYEPLDDTHDYAWYGYLSYKYRFTNVGGHIYEFTIKTADESGRVMTGGIYLVSEAGYISPNGVWIKETRKGLFLDYELGDVDSVDCMIEIDGCFQAIYAGVKDMRKFFSRSDSLTASVIH